MRKKDCETHLELLWLHSYTTLPSHFGRLIRVKLLGFKKSLSFHNPDSGPTPYRLNMLMSSVSAGNSSLLFLPFPVPYSYYAYTEHFYGRNIAAAYYVLNMRGGFR